MGERHAPHRPPRAIVRDETWSAKLRDQDLKAELLRMIEWDRRARYGGDFDTRYLGTRMRCWMDNDVHTELARCWSGFGVRETEQALH
jgi:aminoglycoside 6-adenylyltransferase